VSFVYCNTYDFDFANYCTVIRPGRIGCLEYFARVGELANVYKFVMGKVERYL